MKCERPPQLKAAAAAAFDPPPSRGSKRVAASLWQLIPALDVHPIEARKGSDREKGWIEGGCWMSSLWSYDEIEWN